MQLTFENAFDSKNSAKTKFDSQRSDGKFNNRADKQRTYVVDENERSAKDFQKQKKQEQRKYHVVDENLTYYESNSQNENEIIVNFVSSIVTIIASEFRCRHCRKSFSSNNDLHRYVRVDCANLRKAFIVKIDIVDSTHFQSFRGIQIVYFIDVSFIDVIQDFFLRKIFTDILFVISLFVKTILRFSVDSIFDVEIDYEFRK